MRLISLLLTLLAATAPAPQAPTTPEAFMRQYTAAVEARDRDALMKLYACETDAHRAKAKAMIELDLLAQELASAVRDHLGISLVRGGYFYSPGITTAWDIGPERATVKVPPVPPRMPNAKQIRPSAEIYPNLLAKDGEYRVEVAAVHHGAGIWGRTAVEIRHVIKQVKADQCRSMQDVIAFEVGDESFLQRDPAVPLKPTTLPATRPTAIDLSSPLEAYRSYARAVIAGDAETYLRIVLCETDEDRTYEAAYARWFQSTNNLWRVAATHYGRDDAELVVHGMFFPDAHSIAISAINELKDQEPKIDGDEATVHTYGLGSDHLVRVKGEWRVLSWTRGQTRTDQDLEWKNMYPRLADIADRTASRIQAGEFPTALAAFESIGLKLTNGREAGPTSRPTP